jgi:hypothetical protein
MTMTGIDQNPPEPSARARQALTGLLYRLGIGPRQLELRHTPGAWQLHMDCRTCGSCEHIMLELDAGVLDAVDGDPALREALLIELDEHLAECERWTDDKAPPPTPRDPGGCIRQFRQESLR